MAHTPEEKATAKASPKKQGQATASKVSAAVSAQASEAQKQAIRAQKDKIAAEQVVFDVDDIPITPESVVEQDDAFRRRSLNIVTIKDKWDAQSRTLDMSNLEDEEAPDNVEEAIAFFTQEVTDKMANVRYTFKKEDLYAFLYTKISAIAKYYSKKGDGPSFAFRPLTVVGKEYWSDYLHRDESRVGPLLVDLPTFKNICQDPAGLEAIFQEIKLRAILAEAALAQQRGYQIIAINLNTNLGKMYEHAMNFLNYWKAAEDENVELKKKVVLLENTLANSGTPTAAVDNMDELQKLRHENASLREKVSDLQEELQLGFAKLGAAMSGRAREENDHLERDFDNDNEGDRDDRSRDDDSGRDDHSRPDHR
ncbi:hypothetical protein N0V85_009779, partial [Neurospora sp. IMI 360204]